MKPIKTIHRGSANIAVFFDNDAENPRSLNSNICHMICRHRRYTLGDDHDGIEQTLQALCLKHGIDPYGDPDDDNDEMDVPGMIEALTPYVVIRPIAIYDHGGVSVFWADGKRSICDLWDTSLVGFGFVESEDIERAGLPKPGWRQAAIRAMDAEMEDYSAYVNGECYGCSVTDEQGEEIYNAWGYIGDSGYKQMLAQAYAEIA